MSTESEGLQVAPDAGGEPDHPDLLERLEYHVLERDDLTVDEVLDVLARGWRNVPGRTERQMLLQLLWLMASARTQPSTTPAPQAGSLEAVAWRYVPSDVWGGPVLTQDPKTVALARQFGRDVEALFTQSQLDAAVAAALATPPAVAVQPPPPMTEDELLAIANAVPTFDSGEVCEEEIAAAVQAARDAQWLACVNGESK